VDPEHSYSFEATYYRTALLLGLIDGVVVHHWAKQVIERDRQPRPEFIDVVSVPPADITALRHALWPLVVDPEPEAVLEVLFGVLRADLASGRRSVTDTLTILRQMRSMLRLPRVIYAGLNAALVAYAAGPAGESAIADWLAQFAESRSAAYDSRE